MDRANLFYVVSQMADTNKKNAYREKISNPKMKECVY